MLFLVVIVLAAATHRGTVSIKDLDFANFAYPSFAGLPAVHLRNGDYCSSGDYQTCVTLASVVFGDVTGDGEPEAAVTLGAVFRYGNGSHTDGFLYTLRAGQPRLIGRFAGGDRGNGGIIKTAIRGQRLVVTRLQASCPACTDATEEDTFKWNGRHLVLVSSSIHEENR
ncbi:MAG TPA: hypothetical protein VER58_19465 [Thermoanaerobaculia bacterium]|nr:hypothetical protein [Thermoanaerobaculia bacterium]